MVQLVGRRTARARKTTRVRFMEFLLDVVCGRERPSAGTPKQASCQGASSIKRRQKPRNSWHFRGVWAERGCPVCGDLVWARWDCVELHPTVAGGGAARSPARKSVVAGSARSRLI